MRQFYRERRRALETLVFGIFIVLACSPALGQGTTDEFDDFSEITLEELLNQKVESASKHEQNLRESANAITVITAEDIKRSGARSVPEALKMVPGVFVAQVHGNKWIVTMGGFVNDVYPNKLLVLVDGVTIYDPIVAGVRWESLTFSIDEVEKIEVIRGPGGVLYGANAVDGVINIYTKSAGKNSGSYVNVKGGTQDYRSANAAATLSSDEALLRSRLAVSYTEDEGLGMNRGQEYDDGKEYYSASLRNEVKLGGDATFHLDGRFASGVLDYPAEASTPGTYDNEITVFRTRLEQFFDNGHQYYIQAYYRRHYIQQQVAANDLEEYLENATTDVEFHHSFPFEAMGDHRFTWGGGYRWVTVKMELLEDGERDNTIASAFINDEWRPVDKIIVNAGLKYEQNGFLEDPTWHWRGALIYMPTPEHGFRVSAANAYRSPNASDLFFNGSFPIPPEAAALFPPGTEPPLFTMEGNEDLEPEKILSYEVGYRGVWFERINVDASYAYREYSDLISTRITDPGFYVIIPPSTSVGPFDSVYSYNNEGEATSQTAELGVDARISRELRLLLNYGYKRLDVDKENGAKEIEEYSPENFGRIGLSYTHAAGFMADVSGSYFDEFTVLQNGVTPHLIEDYWRIDARLAQKVKVAGGEIEVGLVGENLGEEWHEEYMSTIGGYPYPIRTSYYGYLEYREQ